MSSAFKDCSRARRDLMNLGRLDAVSRGRLDLHLRRCEDCRLIHEDLVQFEKGAAPIPPISDAHAREIYDRLVPAVHQIAVDLRHDKKVPFLFPLRPALGIGAAVVAIGIFVLLGGDLTESATAGKTVSVSSPETTLNVVRKGYVDRAEGLVRIDKVILEDTKDSFKVKKGTTIELEQNAIFSFRVGDTARVALVDDTLWRVTQASERLIEMEIDRGRIAVQFDGTSGQMLDVRTPDSLVRVRGTVFTVEVSEEGTTSVGVVEGRVEVLPLGGSFSPVMDLLEGQAVQVPGEDKPRKLSAEQRALAGQVEAMADNLVASVGRMVRFRGSPERVKVEIDGRHIGYTPLTVRLPEGPVSYRLSAPGMEPYDSTLTRETAPESVRFEMAPSVDYQPTVVDFDAKPDEPQRTRSKASNRSSGNLGRWNLVDRAKAAMTAGDIPYAIGLLERAVRGQTGDRLVTVNSLLAECYSVVGRYTEAADTFDLVASLVPGSKIAQNSRYEVGRLSMDHLGDYGRARTAFTAYLGAPLPGPLREEAYFSLCELYGYEAAHRNALQCFNDFLRSFPGGNREPNALLWRGALYQDVQNRWTEAERDLQAFIEARPRHPRVGEARYRIALGRYKMGNHRGAMQMLNEYLSKHPTGQYSVRVKRLRQSILDPDFSMAP